MKFIRTVCATACIALSTLTFADLTPTDTSTGDTSPDSKLTDYFLYFGQYIGYDFTQQPPSIPPITLFNATAEQNLLSALVSTFFSALPVNSTQSDYAAFVPSGSSDAALNSFANATFSSYNTPNSNGTSNSISVNALIDQQAYQTDPVNQALLNILSTPSGTNDSNCQSCTGASCNPLCQAAVANNVIGPLPLASDFYATSYNANVINQLNVNTLIAPLLYSTSSSASTTQSSGASGTSNNSTNAGLQAQNQMELAANFVRYAIGGVSPTSLPTYDDYSSAYTASLAVDASGNPTPEAIQQKAVIANYLASLRTYVAQSSVGISNVYAILAKRLPQTTATDATPTSEALTEYRMATWRINPSSSADGSKAQWVDQLNTATPATVAKEMAILLAEINYQLYLNRQEQERLILASSILLLQSRSAPAATLTTSTSTAPSAQEGS